jgi:hypothetical protein
MWERHQCSTGVLCGDMSLGNPASPSYGSSIRILSLPVVQTKSMFQFVLARVAVFFSSVGCTYFGIQRPRQSEATFFLIGGEAYDCHA